MAVHTYCGFTAAGGPAGVGGGGPGGPHIGDGFVLLTITLSVYGQSGNFHLSVTSGGERGATRYGASRIDPIWWAPVMVLVLTGIVTMTALLFNGTLRKVVPFTLVSDRAGLVMEPGAKVKHGAWRSVRWDPSAPTPPTGPPSPCASIPNRSGYLPSNVEAEIKSSTAFGAKYVDLVVPDTGVGHR